jgi:methyl-CpG-binding domain protein 4
VKLSIDVEAQRAKHGGRVKNVSACHGVGVYASDAHALFVDGVLAGPPRDHALRWYHAWAAERRDRRIAAARAAAPQ